MQLVRTTLLQQGTAPKLHSLQPSVLLFRAPSSNQVGNIWKRNCCLSKNSRTHHPKSCMTVQSFVLFCIGFPRTPSKLSNPFALVIFKVFFLFFLKLFLFFFSFAIRSRLKTSCYDQRCPATYLRRLFKKNKEIYAGPFSSNFRFQIIEGFDRSWRSCRSNVLPRCIPCKDDHKSYVNTYSAGNIF